MPTFIKAVDFAHAVPFPALLKKGLGEGEQVNPFDLSFTWKIKVQDSGFAFAVYEMSIEPGTGIPLHIHPLDEFFYVLEGVIDAVGLDQAGALTFTPVGAGECANAGATTPHGVQNRSGKQAKFLSVSTYEHQRGFDDYQALLKTPEGQAMTEDEKKDALLAIFAEYKILFLDVGLRQGD